MKTSWLWFLLLLPGGAVADFRVGFATADITPPVGWRCAGSCTEALSTGQRQLTKFGGTSVCTPSAWSPDGQWISFRRTDERYWSNPERMKLIYSTKPADKRPVWVIRPDGTEATLIESLRFQMAIDGSRASWKPARKRP